MSFEGPARVFESEDAASPQLQRKQIKAGDCIVIRNEGLSRPRQRECWPLPPHRRAGLSGQRCAHHDGRFSGATYGFMVGHVSPEAAKGGPIGKIKDGDVIKIDVEKRTIDVAADLSSRPWTAPQPNYPTGAYAKYAALVASASEGAVTSFPFNQTEETQRKGKYHETRK